MAEEKSTLGGYKTINEYVFNKLKKIQGPEYSFGHLFGLMFSERNNIFFEQSKGFELRKITYGEAYDRVLELTGPVHAAVNAPHGSVVGLYMENGPEWVEFFWAILRCGWNPVLLNLRLGNAILEGILKDCGACAVISGSDRFSVRTVPVSEIGTVYTDDGFVPGDFGEELLITSSGTSRHVKICSYSAKQICRQITDSGRIISECALMKKHYHGSLKQLTLLPFCHIFGLTAVYFWFGYFSRTFVALNSLAPETVVSTIRDHEVTHIFAVPLFWEKIYETAMKTIRSKGEKTWNRFCKGMGIYRKLYRFPALQRTFSRLCMKDVRANLFGDSLSFEISGGGAISPDVLEFFNAVGYHLVNGYGTTEAGITSVETGSDQRIINSGTVGKPFCIVEYRVVDGELQIFGDSMCTKIRRGSEVRENNGWYATGDLAHEVDGRFYLDGRQDDMIVSPSGENLNPLLIEQQLQTEGVRRMCLIRSEKDGVVLLVSREVSELPDEELKERVAKKAEEAKVLGEIRRIVILQEDLITGGDFKVDRRKIAERYDAGKFVSAFTQSTAEAAEEGSLPALVSEIRQIFAESLNADENTIAMNANFFLDCGGDSLAYLGMVAELEERYGIGFPSAGERSLATVSEIAEYIVEHRNADVTV